jgi:hypothetical protein
MGHPGRKQMERILKTAKIKEKYNADLCEVCVMAGPTHISQGIGPKTKYKTPLV